MQPPPRGRRSRAAPRTAPRSSGRHANGRARPSSARRPGSAASADMARARASGSASGTSHAASPQTSRTAAPSSARPPACRRPSPPAGSARSPRAAPGARAPPPRRAASASRWAAGVALEPDAGAVAGRGAREHELERRRAGIVAIAGVGRQQQRQVLAGLVVADVEEVASGAGARRRRAPAPARAGRPSSRSAATPQRARTSARRRVADADHRVGAPGRVAVAPPGPRPKGAVKASGRARKARSWTVMTWAQPASRASAGSGWWITSARWRAASRGSCPMHPVGVSQCVAQAAPRRHPRRAPAAVGDRRARSTSSRSASAAWRRSR